MANLEKDLNLKRTKATKDKIIEFVKKGEVSAANLSREVENLEAKIKEIQSKPDKPQAKKAFIDKGLAKGRVELTKASNKLNSLEKDKKDKEKSLRKIQEKLDKAQLTKIKLIED